MFEESRWSNDDHPKEEGKNKNTYTISDIDLNNIDLISGSKFAVTFIVSTAFFLLPINWKGQTTTPLDASVSFITDTFPFLVELFILFLLLQSGVLTILSILHSKKNIKLNSTVAERLDLPYWQTSTVFAVLRIVSIPIGFMIFLDIGPAWLLSSDTAGLLWNDIMPLVVVVIPIGALFVNYMSELGGLEFVGTLARPAMKPMFHLPGRASLDAAASWFGSFSVGYYLTRNVFDRGGYHKRDVFVICTCFATASIGTLAVMSGILGLLPNFFTMVAGYMFCTFFVGFIVIRIPPLSTIPKEYIVEPNPERKFSGSILDYLRVAVSEATKQAEAGDTVVRTTVSGFVDGIKLTATLTGTVLVIGLLALSINAYTPTFEIIASPLVPVIDLLGIPQPRTAAVAILVGFAEVIVASSVAANAALVTKFYVIILVASQAIFFAAPAPMMMDMFDDIPIRFRDLVILFVIRTLLLIPTAAAVTHLFLLLNLI